MAVRGQKPKAAVIQLVTGRRPLKRGSPEAAGQPRPPIKMDGRPAALWRRYIAKAWWLADADSPKAWLWCHMQAEAEADPTTMTAARIGQLRALGSELGLDPASRARMAGERPGGGKDGAEQYFG